MAEALTEPEHLGNEATRRRAALPKRPRQPVEYPDSDGEPMETPRHYFAGVYAVTVLMRHFGKAMHFGANNGVYYRKNDLHAVVVPDVYAVSGKPQTVEDWYFLWDHDLPPDFVLEMASKTTYQRDKVAKRDIYARIGVKDYFMFDPTGRYLDEPLLGFRLSKTSHKALEPTRLPDGGLSIRSEILKLDLRAWRGDDHPTLRFFDPVTSSYLLSAEEQAGQAERQQQEAERQQRESEQTIAALRARIADLEAQRGA